MTSKLVMTKKDPRHTSFVLVGDGKVSASRLPVYSSDTKHYARPRNGSRATTTITRTDPNGDRFQVGLIDWPVHPQDRPPLVIGTRTVKMTKSGIFTSCVSSCSFSTSV